ILLARNQYDMVIPAPCICGGLGVLSLRAGRCCSLYSYPTRAMRTVQKNSGPERGSYCLAFRVFRVSLTKNFVRLFCASWETLLTGTIATKRHTSKQRTDSSDVPTAPRRL